MKRILGKSWAWTRILRSFTAPQTLAVAADLQFHEYWEIIRSSAVSAEQIVLHTTAFAFDDGVVKFTQSKSQGQSGSYSVDPGMRDAEGPSLAVEARSFTSILSSFGRVRPDFLKLDIEGLEAEFLLKMAEQPEESLPLVILADMDSICCCMGPDCSRKEKLGLMAIDAMRNAGYTALGAEGRIADVTFFLKDELDALLNSITG